MPPLSDALTRQLVRDDIARIKADAPPPPDPMADYRAPLNRRERRYLDAVIRSGFGRKRRPYRRRKH